MFFLMGRNRIYATDAERVAAYRKREADKAARARRLALMAMQIAATARAKGIADSNASDETALKVAAEMLEKLPV